MTWFGRMASAIRFRNSVLTGPRAEMARSGRLTGRERSKSRGRAYRSTRRRARPLGMRGRDRRAGISGCSPGRRAIPGAGSRFTRRCRARRPRPGGSSFGTVRTRRSARRCRGCSDPPTKKSPRLGAAGFWGSPLRKTRYFDPVGPALEAALSVTSRCFASPLRPWTAGAPVPGLSPAVRV